MDQPAQHAELAKDCANVRLHPKSDLTQLRHEFDRCWPWLWASLCEFGPTHNKEHVWLRLASRQAFLWPGKSCAIIGELITWPIGLKDFNYWLQGGTLDECKQMHAGIEAWAHSRGAHRATGHGRDGWIRVMDGAWEKGPTTRIKWLNGEQREAV